MELTGNWQEFTVRPRKYRSGGHGSKEITGVIPFAPWVGVHFAYGITGIPFATFVVAHFAYAERTAFRI